MLETIVVGIMLFASTNIDDIFLTMAFFADSRLDRRAVVAGKFLGISLIVTVSIAAAACAMAVPPEWVALLGFAPLGLGLHRLWSAWRAPPGVTADEEGIPAAAGSLVAQACSVAGVTAANGGDNLGVYVPVFSERFQVIPVFAVIFAVMTGLWCIGGNLLVNHRLVAATMRRLAGRLLPWVLIVLGLCILAGARGLVMPVRP
ncbi:MAG: cadmium resistance transporter [Planctomycetaceae bacterium]|nr:cadmium resistance transporter [Planctomycetaceae bacterium]